MEGTSADLHSPDEEGTRRQSPCSSQSRPRSWSPGLPPSESSSSTPIPADFESSIEQSHGDAASDGDSERDSEMAKILFGTGSAEDNLDDEAHYFWRAIESCNSVPALNDEKVELPIWLGVDGLEEASQGWICLSGAFKRGLFPVLRQAVARQPEIFQRLECPARYKDDEGSILPPFAAMFVELFVFMLNQTLGELAKKKETLPEQLLNQMQLIAGQATASTKGKERNLDVPFRKFLCELLRQSVAMSDEVDHILYHLRLYERTAMGDGSPGDVAVMKHIQDITDISQDASVTSAEF